MNDIIVKAEREIEKQYGKKVTLTVTEHGGNWLQHILTNVCRYYKVTEEQLQSKQRHLKYDTPRKVFCVIAFDTTHYISITNKLRAIGRYIKRERTTVINHINIARDYYRNEQEFKEAVNTIKQNL